MDKKFDFDLGMVLINLDEGNISKVIDYCNKYLEKELDDVHVYLYKAKAYYEIKEYEKALFTLAQAMERDFHNYFELRLIYEEMVEVNCARHKYETALYWCNKAVSLDPTDIDLLMTKAILLYRNALFQEALDTLQLLRSLDIECLYRSDIEELKAKILSWLL
jgi:tetratricopeptide (TPR) repeat protein